MDAKLQYFLNFQNDLRILLGGVFQTYSQRFQDRAWEIINLMPRTTQELQRVIEAIPSAQEVNSTAIWMATEYWDNLQYTGFSLKFVDDVLYTIVVFRFILYTIKYNTITSVKINVITGLATYIWYSTFLNMLDAYEMALYRTSYTIQLGMDASRLDAIATGRDASRDAQYSITNPTALFLYLTGKGTTYQGHKIDPISMAVANLSDQGVMEYLDESIKNFIDSLPIWLPSTFTEWIDTWLNECLNNLKLPELILNWKSYVIETYYYFYLKLIPHGTKAIIQFFEGFRSYIQYSYMVRVGRTKCPYFIRWHWTVVMFLNFGQAYPMYLIDRTNCYVLEVIQPKIIEAKQFGLTIPSEALKANLMMDLCMAIIICHLAFLLYCMLHAVCGQYFYIPILTLNSEMHIGNRDKYDIYSGGYTAWQDENPDETKFQFWYGWCGRGTKKPFILFSLIRTFIYKPVYKVVLVLAWPFKKIRQFLNKKK